MVIHGIPLLNCLVQLISNKTATESNADLWHTRLQCITMLSLWWYHGNGFLHRCVHQAGGGGAEMLFAVLGALLRIGQMQQCYRIQ